MNVRLLDAAAVAVALAVVAPAAGAQERAMEARHHGPMAGEEAVREAVEAFQRAQAAGDSAAVMGLLHPDATIYESGHPETRDEYAGGHLGADMAFASSVEREVLEDDVIVHGPLAIYTSVARRMGTFRDREIDSVGTETLVLRQDGSGRWRIRHVHWSSR